MSDYSESGARPVDDAAVDDPPTVDEVAREQAERFPEQATGAPPPREQPPVGGDGPERTTGPSGVQAPGRETSDPPGPLEGLMNPEEGRNSPASDADAPPPG